MKFILPALLATVALTGCAQLGVDPLPSAPYTPANYLGESRLPAEIRRVAILPAHSGNPDDADSVRTLDSTLLSALQRQTRFEVVVVSPDECRRRFGAFSFNSTAALPPGLMSRLAEVYAVDAVLFTDVTAYQPYRPISLGFRSKLVTVNDLRLVWAFDEVFSASQASMVSSVREYYRDSDQSTPSDVTDAALQSPTRFGAVAADLMFRTLPAR
jgi:hypothetical protein